MKKLPRVSIIILNWNGLGDTLECLESLFEITYPNYEVIVVDNASSGDDVSVLKKRFGRKIKLIVNDRNYGFAEGNNIAIREVMKAGKSKYVLLLNNDTVVDKRFLDELVKVADGEDKIGITAPVNYNYYTREIDFGGGKINWWLGRPYHLKKIDSRKYTDFITGCCMLIKTNTLKEIGLFDPVYYCYFEDADLCERFKRRGYRLRMAPVSKIWHKISATMRKKGRIYYYVARNRVIFNKKYNLGFRLTFFMFIHNVIKKNLAHLVLDKDKYSSWIGGFESARKY